MISEERLREIVQRVLTELETIERPAIKQRKIYMLCTSSWDDRFSAYLKKLNESPEFQVYPVIPLSWEKGGLVNELLSYPSCGGIIYRSCEKPLDLEQAVTVLPVVPRDVVVKTALCIADTFETDWIASCIERGSKVVFYRDGLARFSGKEPESYKNQILSYYRTVLTYGIDICGDSELPQAEEAIAKEKHSETMDREVHRINEKKRVITASNVEKLAADGILYISRRDVVTDLARDRAKFLNIVLKEQASEVKR